MALMVLILIGCILIPLSEGSGTKKVEMPLLCRPFPVLFTEKLSIIEQSVDFARISGTRSLSQRDN